MRYHIFLLLSFLLPLSAQLTLAEEKSSGTPSDEAPVEIHALVLAGTKEMQALKKVQDEHAAELKRIEALVQQIPKMTPEQGFQLAKNLGAELNGLLRSISNADPYRDSSGPGVELQVKQAEEILIWVTMAKRNIEVDRKSVNKAVHWTMAGGIFVATLASVIEIALHLPPGLVISTFAFGGTAGFVGGGMAVDSIGGMRIQRKLNDGFREAFENELDPAFRKLFKFQLEANTETAQQNLKQLKQCTSLLLNGNLSVQKLLP